MNTTPRRTFWWPLASLALASSACSSMGPASEDLAPAPLLTVDAVPVFDGHTGSPASWDELRAAIAKADVVVLGELHGHPVGLPFDAKLFTEAMSEHPGAALCLEFLTRDSQYLVDAYLDDVIDWEAFEETVSRPAGSDPRPHRPLLEAAREAGVPVFAANAPRTYTRAAKNLGYAALEELGPEQQRMFDIPYELPSGPYQEGFYEMMASHSEETFQEGVPSPALVDKFRAQALWDATMSTSVANALDKGHWPVFLVVGSYHCNADGGTVQLLRRRRPNAEILVISFVDELADSFPEEDRNLADFVAYVGPFPE